MRSEGHTVGTGGDGSEGRHVRDYKLLALAMYRLGVRKCRSELIPVVHRDANRRCIVFKLILLLPLCLKMFTSLQLNNFFFLLKFVLPCVFEIAGIVFCVFSKLYIYFLFFFM